LRKANFKHLFLDYTLVAGNHIQQCIDRLASSDDSQQTDSHSNRLTIVIPTAFDQGLFDL
jgi:hypothetical protein